MEIYLRGKTEDPKLCEDGIFIGKKLIVVIDGVTSKGKLKWFGDSSGKYAKDVLYKYLTENEDFNSAEEFFQSLSYCLRDARRMNEGCKFEDYPRASVIAYSVINGKIWSYGDCNCMINGILHSHGKQIDKINSEKRAEVIENAIIKNGEHKVMEHLKVNDFGRDAIKEGLQKQLYLENRHLFINGLDYGYPVINGESICSEMIVEYEVYPGDHIVLATDGYPVLKGTLKESETALDWILKNDPMCFRKYKSTKGLQNNYDSFDDRAYISLTIPK